MTSNEPDRLDRTMEPNNAEEARKIIQDVRFRCGILGDEGDAELNKLTPEWRQRFAGNAKATRENLAAFTKL